MGVSIAEAMNMAIALARGCIATGDVPVGAVVLHNGVPIGLRRNEREHLGDPTAHAEILALSDAALELGKWRLDECALVVTLEPCVMCAGAISASRIKEVFFGAFEPRSGGLGSVYNIADDPRLDGQTRASYLAGFPECAELMRGFFKSVRSTG